MVDGPEPTGVNEHIELIGKLTVLVPEEGPLQMIARYRHDSISLNRGLVLLANASNARRKSPVAMQIACAAPGFEQLIDAHRPFLIEHLLVIECANHGPVARSACKALRFGYQRSSVSPL